MRTLLPILILISPLAFAKPAEPEKAKADEKPYGALEYRLIGPAIGGRVSRVAGVPGDPYTWWLGAAQGGVWKSTDGGRDWQPMFDKESTNSIGSLAVAPSDPNVVYVGGGEANIRGNVMVGWGIWKTTDAGATWQHVWKNKGQIGTMLVHPSNPDVAYAAVLGSPFGAGENRGVYRTKDGGATWQKVLYVDANTGASDVAMDAHNPRILFAGTWQTRREPWRMTSGGAGSALYRSADGGDTWKKVEADGLPKGPWGKVGVAVAPSDPSRVYALIEAEAGGLYRSDDGGETWSLANAHRILRQRAWYYSTITVDPTNADVVWFPQVPLLKSVDGGKTLQRTKGWHHGDMHDAWIDPKDPRRMIVGNDGGVDLSFDGGKTWFSPDLPLAQFYNIDVDDRVPWHVGGTMQDWGTAVGPNAVPANDGPTLTDWRVAGGGEAGDFKFDPTQEGAIYAGEYGGYISHYVEGTGQYRNVSAWPANPSGTKPSDLAYRFQWTAPMEISPHDPKVIYHGANVLFRSADRGNTWTKLSGDLTRNDRDKQGWSGGPITGDITGVETYGTIFSIEESPVAKGMIWVGTDDGLVQVTRDGGASWSNVTPKGFPAWATVEGIEASARDADTAYVAIDARRVDDQKPYLYRTRDGGRSWTSITNGLPAEQMLFVVREDPVDPNILYVGGENGVFISRDAGDSFAPLKLNLPAIAVTDLEVKHGALVLGTRRSIWSLDDLATVRQLDASVRSEQLHVFEPAPAIRWANDQHWGSQGKIDNPPDGVTVSYWLAKKSEEPVTGEVKDESGRVIRKLSSVPRPLKYDRDDVDEPTDEEPKGELTKDEGLNRATWDLRMDGAKRIAAKIDAGNPELGPRVPPGRYTLEISALGQKRSVPLVVNADPRVATDAAGYAQKLEFTLAARDALDRAATTIEAVRAIREQVADVRNRVAKNADATAVRDAADAVIARCDAIEGELHNPKAEVVYDILSGREGGAKLYSQISPLYDWIQSADLPPTQGMTERLAFVTGELRRVEGEVAALRAAEVARFEAAVASANLPRVIVP